MTALIDLHLDLLGAAPPALIRGLAAEKKHDISKVFHERGGYCTTNFAEYMNMRDAVASVVLSPEDWQRLARAVLEAGAADGVIHAEMLLAPEDCRGADPGAWREVLAALGEVAGEIERREGLSARLIAVTRRQSGPARARAAALVAAETAGGILAGFGLVGDETVLEPKDFAWPFDAAREAGLRLVAEAGQRRGAASVRSAWRDLRPGRIAHGARLAEDPALAEELAEAGIALVLTPGGDLALGLYPDLRAHPVESLRARGVRAVLASGSPAFTRLSLAALHVRLADALGWDEGEFAGLAEIAAKAAFLSEEERVNLLKRLEKAHA